MRGSRPDHPRDPRHGPGVGRLAIFEDVQGDLSTPSTRDILPARLAKVLRARVGEGKVVIVVNDACTRRASRSRPAFEEVFIDPVCGMIDTMADPPILALTFEPPADDLRQLRDAVVAHGRSRAGVGDPRPVACLARAGGALVGGASGRIEFARVFVETLWVDPALRGRGLGTRLLAALEDAAHTAGCRDALIETLDDDTAALYRRLGYATLAAIADYIPGYTRHVLLKKL